MRKFKGLGRFNFLGGAGKPTKFATKARQRSKMCMKHEIHRKIDGV